MNKTLLLICGLSLTGAALAQSATQAAYVLARPLEGGDIVAAADLTRAEVPVSQARSALDASAIVGREVTRHLAAGVVLRSYDVAAPQLVKRGQPVSIVYRRANLVITASGRALTGGARGDAVRVQNTLSPAVFEAEVESTGVVHIASGPSSN